MALNPVDLANDLKNDINIMGVIPNVATERVHEFFDRLAIHITNQIKRGVIDDVQVTDGSQTNISNVK